jgi:hypothetical protein
MNRKKWDARPNMSRISMPPYFDKKHFPVKNFDLPVK